jgi:S-adenosylmethionine/arginine decarboxylase-like enzyme
LTMVFLLSESHASIHTYPEHGACFVDLFTCGNKCSGEKFDQALREYLKPAHVTARVLIRDEGIAERSP